MLYEVWIVNDYQVFYSIEADSEEEALELAKSGTPNSELIKESDFALYSIHEMEE